MAESCRSHGQGGAMWRVCVAQTCTAADKHIVADGDPPGHGAFGPIRFIGQHDAGSRRVFKAILFHQSSAGQQEAAVSAITVHMVPANLESSTAGVEIVEGVC